MSIPNNSNNTAIKRLFAFWVELVNSCEKIQGKEILNQYITELIESGNTKFTYIEEVLYVEDEEHFDDYELEYIVGERLADYLKTKLLSALYTVYYAKGKIKEDEIFAYFYECADILDENVYQQNIEKAVTFQEQMQCIQTDEIKPLFTQYTDYIKQGNFQNEKELDNIEKEVFRVLDLG